MSGKQPWEWCRPNAVILALVCVLLQAVLLVHPARAQSLGEALDAPGFARSTSGDAAWFGQTVTTHDGVDAAQNGDISDSQSSDLIVSNVQGPVGISFWWKISSEASWDFLGLYVDDVLQFRISGEVNWTRKSVILPSGTHTVRWTYSKDRSVSSGSDTGWVDEVTIGTAPETQTRVLQRCGLGRFNCLDLSPDGRFLATGSRSGRVFVWRLDTHEVVRSISTKGNIIMHVEFGASGQSLLILSP